jgi:hypothetical protein
MVVGKGLAPESGPETKCGEADHEEVDERRTDLTPVGHGAAIESGAPSA